MNRDFGALAGLSGAVAVIAGAFGAHALRARLAPDLLVAWETGARYEMYHALALAAVAVLAAARPAARGPRVAGWLFVAGTVLFSGSLYVLAVTGVPAAGFVTPVGGVALVGGWLAFAWSAWRS